jgi:hypothetical protein
MHAENPKMKREPHCRFGFTVPGASFDYSDDTLRGTASSLERSHKVTVAMTVNDIPDHEIARQPA